MDDPMLFDFLIYHTFDTILGHISFSFEICRSSWSHMILITHEMHVKLIAYCYLITIPQWSLSWAIQSSSHFLAFRYHHVSSFGRYFFELLIRFSYGRGWLGLHTWWWMIWCHLIFRPTTHLMPYWGIFMFWLRFVDIHWFAWSSSFTRYMSSWWSVFILRWFPSGAFLESFNQVHTFWYCRDFVIVLSQAYRLPCHHFNGVHVKSLTHPHWVILELSGQTKCPNCYTGACLSLLAMEMIVFSQTYYSLHYLNERYFFALLVTVLVILAEMSLQMSTTFWVLAAQLSMTFQ